MQLLWNAPYIHARRKDATHPFLLCRRPLLGATGIQIRIRFSALSGIFRRTAAHAHTMMRERENCVCVLFFGRERILKTESFKQFDSIFCMTSAQEL